jgi:hypothetical protein
MSDAAEAPPPEEPPMEIHKPKPVRNWRLAMTALGAKRTLPMSRNWWTHYSDVVVQIPATEALIRAKYR